MVGSRPLLAVDMSLEEDTGCTDRRVAVGGEKGRVGRSSDFGLDCSAGRRHQCRLQADRHSLAAEGSLVVEDNLADGHSLPVAGHRAGLVGRGAVRNHVGLEVDHFGIAGYSLAGLAVGFGCSHTDLDLGPGLGSSSRWLTFRTECILLFHCLMG